VLFACIVTVALSLAAGLALTRLTGVDRPTSSLGMIAGGASGIVAMSSELGADDRLVAVMQYLRVLVVVALTPLVVRVGFGHAGGGHGASAGAPGAAVTADLAFLAGAALVGVLAARLVRLPAGSLLGPLIVAAALTVAGASGGARVPGAIQTVAFALIGLQVGLRFTPDSLRRAGRLLPWVLAAIAALIVACAGLAALLVPLAHVSLLDAYLATTPGGLYAVLATAIGSQANTTFVLAVQALRLFAMVLAAPPLVRWLVRRS
jgi:membrane AbrB-like protein